MRKRSTYRPKPIRFDTLTYVIGGFQPMAGLDESTTLRIKNHAALTALAQGNGTRQDIDLVVAALNITEALARLDVGYDYRQQIKAGQDALLDMATRGIAAGDRYTFKPLELTAINLAMEVHDAQLDAINIQQLDQALGIVRRTIMAGNARVIA